MLRLRRDGEVDAGDEENENLEKAHGTVMIIAWMVFASTAILFSRYGRTIRFGSKDKLLGEQIWFQIHRFLACLTTVLTLLGFFFILSYGQGGWVGSDERAAFAHSIFGGIIVCCALIQAWMALFRCHTDSPFRFIFNGLHRLTGLLAFTLSIPAIFIIVASMEVHRAGMIVILALWSVWSISIVIVLEMIRSRYRKILAVEMNKKNDTEISDNGASADVDVRQNDVMDNIDMTYWNNKIILIILTNMVVSLALAIPLIILIWK